MYYYMYIENDNSEKENKFWPDYYNQGGSLGC